MLCTFLSIESERNIDSAQSGEHSIFANLHSISNWTSPTTTTTKTAWQIHSIKLKCIWRGISPKSFVRLNANGCCAIGFAWCVYSNRKCDSSQFKKVNFLFHGFCTVRFVHSLYASKYKNTFIRLNWACCVYMFYFFFLSVSAVVEWFVCSINSYFRFGSLFAEHLGFGTYGFTQNSNDLNFIRRTLLFFVFVFYSVVVATSLCYVYTERNAFCLAATLFPFPLFLYRFFRDICFVMQ